MGWYESIFELVTYFKSKRDITYFKNEIVEK